MFEIAYAQHRGKVAGSQQDALWNGTHCIQAVDAAPASGESGTPLLLAIADGVAISPSAELASRFALEQLPALVARQGLSGKALRALHGKLSDRYARGQTFGCSTTLVAAYLSDEEVAVVNVGDSRAYRIGAQGAWQTLTRDHTVLNELIDAGLADPTTEYAALYNALTDCLVADHDEDRFAIHQTKARLDFGDCLLLCSDGVHDTLGEARLQALFDPARQPQQQVETWHKAILRAGAPDNFSLILARPRTARAAGPA